MAKGDMRHEWNEMAIRVRVKVISKAQKFTEEI